MWIATSVYASTSLDEVAEEDETEDEGSDLEPKPIEDEKKSSLRALNCFADLVCLCGIAIADVLLESRLFEQAKTEARSTLGHDWQDNSSSHSPSLLL